MGLATLAAAICACAFGTTPLRAQAPPTRAAPAAHGMVHEDAFFSDALGVTKHLVVYLPPSYGAQPGRRYPVAYYLHGLFGSETDWLSKGGIDAVADSLIAAGMPELIIVMPDGDDGWYTTWEQQVPLATCADTLHVEAPERYCVRHERYDDYVAHDVVGWVDAHYRTLADRAHRGIGGLSMGGYGAIALALKHPDLFAAAASHSGVVSALYVGPHPFAAPARYATTIDTLAALKASFLDRMKMFWGTDVAAWRANDPAVLAERLTRSGGPVPALYLDCGSSDGFADENRAFSWELDRLGMAHSYHEYPGAHTWRYWSTHVPQSLGWMGGIIGR